MAFIPADAAAELCFLCLLRQVPGYKAAPPGSAASLHSTKPFLSCCPNAALVFLTSSQNKGLALSTARELCLHSLGFAVPCEHKHLPSELPGWGYFCPDEHMALNSSTSATGAWPCSSLHPQTEPGCERHQGWHQPWLSRSPQPRGHLGCHPSTHLARKPNTGATARRQQQKSLQRQELGDARYTCASLQHACLLDARIKKNQLLITSSLSVFTAASLHKAKRERRINEHAWQQP